MKTILICIGLMSFVFFGCNKRIPLSDTESTNTLQPGGEPPGNLEPISFPALRTRLSLPNNWILVREREYDARFGDIHILTARGPRESVTGIGYVTIRWLTAASTSLGGVINSVVEFEKELSQDYLSKNGSMSAPTQIQVSGRSANQYLFQDQKIVSLNAVSPMTITIRLTSTRLEANGYFHDITLGGSESDHSKYLVLYKDVLSSVRFD